MEKGEYYYVWAVVKYFKTVKEANSIVPKSRNPTFVEEMTEHMGRLGLFKHKEDDKGYFMASGYTWAPEWLEFKHGIPPEEIPDPDEQKNPFEFGLETNKEEIRKHGGHIL